MVRSKLSLKLIGDQRRRNTTFMKRRTGLKKKAMELAMLCDIPILLVCFGPEGQVAVWPEDRGEAYAIIDRFRSASAEDRGKRKYDVSSFFGDAVMKQATEAGGEEDRDLQYCSEEQLLGRMPESSLQELEWVLEGRLKAIEGRMGALRGDASLQVGEQGAELWQLPDQGQQQCYLRGTTPPGEDIFGMEGYWGNPTGRLDEDPAAALGGLHQTLMQPLMLMHGGAAMPPPPAYNPTSFLDPFFQTHVDNMGMMTCLGASAAYNPHPSAAALGGYPYHPVGYSTQAYLNGPRMGRSAPATATGFMPPGPRSAFMDYNGVGGSALCGMKCCFSRCPVIMPGDVVMMLGSAGGSGATEQVASGSGGSNGDTAKHHGGVLYGDGVVGFPQDDPVEEGLGNPWVSPIYPAHPSGATAATPLAADGGWAGLPAADDIHP